MFQSSSLFFVYLTHNVSTREWTANFKKIFKFIDGIIEEQIQQRASKVYGDGCFRGLYHGITSSGHDRRIRGRTSHGWSKNRGWSTGLYSSNASTSAGVDGSVAAVVDEKMS